MANVLCGRMFALLRAGVPHGDATAGHHKLFSRCGACSSMGIFCVSRSLGLEALLGIEIIQDICWTMAQVSSQFCLNIFGHTKLDLGSPFCEPGLVSASKLTDLYRTLSESSSE